MKHVACLSGGKDSTAMTLHLIESGEPLDEIVFFDSGWEWPQVYAHLDALEEKTHHHITRLSPPHTFDYYLTEHAVRRRKGTGAGKVYRHGYGWPLFNNRWCTRIKEKTVADYVGKDAIRYVGIAADELQRVYDDTREMIDEKQRYPLIDHGITQEMALQISYAAGYTWQGLYKNIPRLSCVCCPLQRLDQMRFLRKSLPAKWKHMLELDGKIEKNRGFWNHKTVADLDRRFADEERQGALCLPVSPTTG